ncbi:MAG TPA: CopG family transcriptional regulator [Mycobacterium sp.]|nr:CopG family transcriptional regulator [Mycobacterium sp.]
MTNQRHVTANFSGAGELAAEIAAEAEAIDNNRDAPITDKTTVTRGHGRSKVLQIRLNDDELAELERVAETRGLPPSTVAREAILRMLDPNTTRSADAARLVEDFAKFVNEYGSDDPAPAKHQPAAVRKAKFVSGKVKNGRGGRVRVR